MRLHAARDRASTRVGPRTVGAARYLNRQRYDVGVAMRTPTVCLIGPNDRRYTDYCLEGQVVIQKDIECAPCQRKVCPLGHRNCMVMITVEEVIAAGESLLRAS